VGVITSPTRYETCQACQGVGNTSAWVCLACEGTGQVAVDAQPPALSINIGTVDPRVVKALDDLALAQAAFSGNDRGLVFQQADMLYEHRHGGRTFDGYSHPKNIGAAVHRQLEAVDALTAASQALALAVLKHHVVRPRAVAP
jgi:hypothetical protein